MKSVIDTARKFAIEAHGDQKYGGERPYIYHLDKVAEIAKEFKASNDVIAACYLHDVLEDTIVTSYQLSKLFGTRITHWVGLVTNRSSKELTFERIRTDKNATFIKLCDRLANVRESKLNNKYKREHESFRKILHQDGEYDELWAEIDKILDYRVEKATI